MQKIKKQAIFIFFIIFLTSCEKDNMFNRKTYDKPTAIYDFPDNKLWKHRVNTAAEAIEAFKEFKGIELDVHFISGLNEFQTGHDFPSGISLEAYLDSIPHRSDYYYWIDFKNLNIDNCIASLDKMKSIISKYNLQNKFIVENGNPELLAYFKVSNIFTSLWIPDISETLITSVAENQLYNDLELILSEYQFNAISAHYNMMPFMEQYLRNYNCHIWTNGLITETDKDKIRNFASKSNIKVILVDFSENFMK